MAPLRLGIIGLSADKSAWATSAHISPLTSPPLSSQYVLTALCTSRPETAIAAGKVYGLSEDKAYSDAKAIANDPDVDMVVVSVTVQMHRQLAIPALEARKAVFVEWPLGKNLSEAQELAALARQQGVKTVVGLQARQTPAVLKVSFATIIAPSNDVVSFSGRPTETNEQAKEIIKSGALGRITNTTLVASSSMLYDLKPKYAAMNYPESGGPISN